MPAIAVFRFGDQGVIHVNHETLPAALREQWEQPGRLEVDLEVSAADPMLHQRISTRQVTLTWESHGPITPDPVITTASPRRPPARLSVVTPADSQPFDGEPSPVFASAASITMPAPAPALDHRAPTPAHDPLLGPIPTPTPDATTPAPAEAPAVLSPAARQREAYAPVAPGAPRPLAPFSFELFSHAAPGVTPLAHRFNFRPATPSLGLNPAAFSHATPTTKTPAQQATPPALYGPMIAIPTDQRGLNPR